MRTTLFSRSVFVAALMLPLSVTVADEKPRSHFMSHPVLNLEAQAYTDIEQDTVTITLQATRQSSEQAVVTKELSETVSAVLAEAKKQDKVKVSSGNYYVRPQHDKDGVITSWVGQSQLLFESTDMTAASELAAKYQDKMPIANVRFSVSKQARSQAEQQLMTETAKAFEQRAQAMAQALGFEGFKIKEVHFGGSGAVYRNAKSYSADMPMLAAAPASAELLPIDSGTEEISLSLNGAIYLLDKK